MIYNINGTQISEAYDITGDPLAHAYDLAGNEVLDGDVPVTPLTWDMPEDYKTQVLDALALIGAYKLENAGAYALCQFNDVHLQFSGNEPNFIDYNKGYKVIDRMLFVGDIVTTYNAGSFANALAYMNGASASKKLVAMGNHEYWYYSSDKKSPVEIYKPITNVLCTYMADNALAFYHDDQKNNVRYIALDYFYVTKTHADNGHLLDMPQLDWLAETLENSGSKDVIIFAHTMLNPFLALESGRTLSSSATLQNYQMLVALITAYKSRGTYTVTVDEETHTHDFSGCTGDFVMYTSGHYHALGYGDFGFNMFTCPTLNDTYGGSHKGFVFYLVDKAKKTIKVIQCSPQLTDYIAFDYSY